MTRYKAKVPQDARTFCMEYSEIPRGKCSQCPILGFQLRPPTNSLFATSGLTGWFQAARHHDMSPFQIRERFFAVTGICCQR
jgi:hypothetical protein